MFAAFLFLDGKAVVRFHGAIREKTMGLTHFPHGISSFGVPVMGGGGIPATGGKVFFVNYGAGTDGVGRGGSADRPFKTIDYALSQCKTNNDDVICLMGSATHVLTEMLTVDINRVHLIGIDGSNGRYYGQNAKVSLGVTTAVTDIGTLLNTGIRNSFTNIKFVNSNTLAQALYSVVEGGEYAIYDSCEIYKDTMLDGTTASEMVLNGDSTHIRNCTIGSSANLLVGDIIRANMRLTKGLAGAGKVARDVTIENTRFLKKAAGTASCYIYSASATDVERMFYVKDCLFYNSKLASGDPAQAVISTAAQTEGDILLDSCASINNTKVSTSTGVFVVGAASDATMGIAAQAA